MLNRIVAPGILCFIFFSQLSPASAQQLAALQLNETDFFTDFPIVLTATRLKQPQKDAPIATTIIDREMIEASGFTEIPDLLRLAPGMLVNYDSGHVPAAGYQFLFNRYTVRMQILVDGRSVYTPIFGEMPWTQLGITIDDIERIEVIRGPSSSSYGPNAMTGVISIITRHASRDSGVKVKVNRGKYGKNENFVTVGSKTVNNKLDYKVSLATRKDDGFDLRSDNKDLSIANFRGDYQLTNNDTLTFNATYNSGVYLEDNVFDPVFHPVHEKDVIQSTQQVKWIHTLANKNELSVNYYQQKYDDRNTYYHFSGALFLDESVRTDRKNLEFTHSIFSADYSLSWGLIFRQDKTVSPQYLYQVTNNTVDTKQLYVNTELNLNESNIVNIGLMADNNDTGGTSFSPRISLNHHVNENNVLRASYATSTRSPFVFEEYTNYFVPGFGQVWTDLSDLEPEKIRSFDLGYVGLLNNKKTEVNLRLHKTILSDLIVLEWVPPGGFLQGDGFDVTGLEASVSHKFDNTRILLNYARTKIYSNDSVFDEPEWYQTGSPEDNISLLAMHNFNNGYKGSLGYYYTGTYQELCCEDPQQAPRKRLDLTLSKNFKLGEYNSNIKLVLQNVTNEFVDTRLLNNYDRQGYISFGMEL